MAEIKIVVDADACPVKNEIAETARQFMVPVWMVASYDHALQPGPGVRVIQVDRSSQSADLYISNCLRRGDILVTQDFGLAAVGLAKQATVISFRGKRFDDRSIEFMLEHRHEQAKKRRIGKHTGGPKAFEEKHRKIFLHTLTKFWNLCRKNEWNSE